MGMSDYQIEIEDIVAVAQAVQRGEKLKQTAKNMADAVDTLLMAADTLEVALEAANVDHRETGESEPTIQDMHVVEAGRAYLTAERIMLKLWLDYTQGGLSDSGLLQGLLPS